MTVVKMCQRFLQITFKVLYSSDIRTQLLSLVVIQSIRIFFLHVFSVTETCVTCFSNFRVFKMLWSLSHVSITTGAAIKLCFKAFKPGVYIF